jgi:hypothetical protein
MHEVTRLLRFFYERWLLRFGHRWRRIPSRSFSYLEATFDVCFVFFPFLSDKTFDRSLKRLPARLTSPSGRRRRARTAALAACLAPVFLRCFLPTLLDGGQGPASPLGTASAFPQIEVPKQLQLLFFLLLPTTIDFNARLLNELLLRH